MEMPENHLSLSTMIYFTGAYAAGIYFGTNPEKWFSWVKKNMLLFVLIALISSVALVYFQIKEINKFGGWSLMSALYYIQKMSLSGIIIVLFKNRGESQPRWLYPIASYAFVIYFLHASFLDLIAIQIGPISTMHEIAPFNLFLAGFIYLVLSITLSILVGWTFKKLFGKSSKMLVGV
jgi:hypothetical protein